jgi:hypothetical protein
MVSRSSSDRHHGLVFALAGAGLCAAIWLQRATIGAALMEMRSLSVGAVLYVVWRMGVGRRSVGASGVSPVLVCSRS